MKTNILITLAIYIFLCIVFSAARALDNIGTINEIDAGNKYVIAQQKYFGNMPCERKTVWSTIIYSNLFCPLNNGKSK